MHIYNRLKMMRRVFVLCFNCSYTKHVFKMYSVVSFREENDFHVFILCYKLSVFVCE